MPFELRDHTADVAVAAEGDTLESVFASVADGLAAAMCEEIPDAGADDGRGAGNGGRNRFSFSVEAGSCEALLYDYLADLIYERDVRGVLPVDNEVVIDDPTGDGSTTGDPANGPAAGSATGAWHLDASARGVPLEVIDAREVKAVTYSEMVVERVGEKWRAYVVFDV